MWGGRYRKRFESLFFPVILQSSFENYNSVINVRTMRFSTKVATNKQPCTSFGWLVLLSFGVFSFLDAGAIAELERKFSVFQTFHLLCIRTMIFLLNNHNLLKICIP